MTLYEISHETLTPIDIQILGALAHSSPWVVSQAAVQCIKLFDSCSSDYKHVQAQRFLSPEFSGTQNDPPLRSAIELLAAGHKVLELAPNMRDALCKWLSAFRLVRTVERSVEGIHSLIGNILKRAPAAKIPYLSFEIRYPLLKPMLRELALNPQAGLLGFMFFFPVSLSRLDSFYILRVKITVLTNWQALQELALATEGIETFEGLKRIIL